MAYFYRKKKTTAKKPYVRRPKKVGMASSSKMVHLIKKVAAKTALSELETKYVSTEYNAIVFNSAITTAAECYSCYPLLGPGTGTYQRVGIDITPISVKNSWVVSLASVSRSINVMVDLFVMIDKNNRYYPQVAGGDAPYFLRTGNASGYGSTQLYNGINTDSFKMINKERYTLLKHFRFQLTNNVGNPNGDTTTGNLQTLQVNHARHYSLLLILRSN